MKSFFSGLRGTKTHIFYEIYSNRKRSHFRAVTRFSFLSLTEGGAVFCSFLIFVKDKPIFYPPIQRYSCIRVKESDLWDSINLRSWRSKRQNRTVWRQMKKEWNKVGSCSEVYSFKSMLLRVWPCESGSKSFGVFTLLVQTVKSCPGVALSGSAPPSSPWAHIRLRSELSHTAKLE